MCACHSSSDVRFEPTLERSIALLGGLIDSRSGYLQVGTVRHLKGRPVQERFVTLLGGLIDSRSEVSYFSIPHWIVSKHSEDVTLPQNANHIAGQLMRTLLRGPLSSRGDGALIR